MKFWLKWGGIFGGAFGSLWLIAYLTIVDVWHVPNDDLELAASIAPNLEAGDVVVVAKDWRPTIPELVRCVDPDNPEKFVIGRIVGIGTETVTLNGDVVGNGRRRAPSPHRCAAPVTSFIDGKGSPREVECWQEEFSDKSFEVTRAGSYFAPSPNFSLTVPNGQVFLASDNRPMHVDSRDFGPVDAQQCRRIFLVLWGENGLSSMKMRWVN